jgi:hypothetical protein
MTPKTDTEAPEGGLHIRDLFGFLWDFRERRINHRSFWYGYLMAFVVCEITDAAWDMKMPSVALLLVMMFIAGISKWLQATHPLK